MIKLKRSDRQYTEVEEFEEYEFTSCIAYEMAIRNPRVIELTIELLINQHKKFDDDDISKELEKYEDELFLEYGIVDEFWHKYHFFEEANKIFDDNYKEIITTTDNKSSSVIQEHEGYHRIFHITEDGTTPYYEKHIIFPNFKRPRLHVYSFETFGEVFIDFSTPENELVAYIKHLKRDYDNDIIQSSHEEILGLMPKATDEIKRKSETMADIFYAYDADGQGDTRRKIQNELFNYYADKGIETKTFDYKTLKKYIEFAKVYIENKKYIELVTGKNKQNIFRNNENLNS